MKSFILSFFLCLPFLVEAQSNTFTSNGYIKGSRFIDKITVVSVDLVNDSLFIGGGGYAFTLVNEILPKCPLCHAEMVVKLDNGQVNSLFFDSEGLRGVYCPQFKIRYEVEIGDYYAKMLNARK